MQHFVALFDRKQIDPLPLEGFHGMFGALVAWNSLYLSYAIPFLTFLTFTVSMGTTPRDDEYVQ